MIARLLTETELRAYNRRRAFHEKIAAHAAALTAPKEPPAPVPAIEPEVVAAEADPLRGYKAWFTIVGVSPSGTTIAEVKAAVAASFDVSVAELSSHRRHARLVLPRQVAMWLCKELVPEKSYPQIGRRFGRRDHATVMHSCRVVPVKMACNPELAARVAAIRADLEAERAGQ